jgi:hypothetical protein
VKSSSFAPAAKADDQREPAAGNALRVMRHIVAGDPDVRLRSRNFNACGEVKVADLSHLCDQRSGGGCPRRMGATGRQMGSSVAAAHQRTREVAPYADASGSSFINENNLL